MTGPRAADPTDRQKAHGQLLSIIADLAESGRPAPCLGRNRDAWTSEDPDHQEYAAAQCLACPALQQCAAYVNEFPEPSNSVWAGMTLTERKNSAKKNTQTTTSQTIQIRPTATP